METRSNQTSQNAAPSRNHWPTRGELKLIAGFWLLLTLIRIGNRLMHGDEHWLLEAADGLLGYGTWMLLTPLIFWLGRRFPLQSGRRWSRGAMHIGIGVFIAVVWGTFHRYIHLRLIHDPENWQALHAIFLDFLSLGFIGPLLFYIAIFMAGRALDYYHRYQRQRLQLKEARLEALRMQLNPHFLFNALNTVSMLTERDPRAARKVIARLAGLLRYALEDSDEAEVPLEKELEFLQRYLDILRHRFGERLDIRWIIADDVREALVPDLILQPLVENAVRHGVSQKEEDGVIEIEGRREDRTLRLFVRDDGPGWPAEEPPEQGTGLRNTAERLDALYGQAGQLSVRNTTSGGVEAEISLPYHRQTDLRVRAASDAS